MSKVKKDDNKLEFNNSITNSNFIEEVLEDAYEGLIVVDEEGKVIKFNKSYQNFLGIEEKDILGKKVTEVIENTRMDAVLETGKPEKKHIQKINGHNMICSRIPIKKDGKIVGAVGKVLFQDIKELEILINRINKLEKELDYYKEEVKSLYQAKYSFDNIIGKNELMKYLKKFAKKSANSNSTVLIQGESGTGKELFAHAIHMASDRKYGSFVRVNCSAIPKDLFESELFGYEKGAFSGAREEGKPGKFEVANNGTILLDEIGSMPKEMQAKLLRVIQEKEFTRIGSTKTYNLDVRIIASTNEDLEKEVKKGNFREDLYYRLNVIRLKIPPLRERIDDIPLLAENILKELTNELNTKKKEFAPETINKLKEYHWPGNVRELHNFIERALNASSGKTIYSYHLPKPLNNESVDKKTNNWDLKKIVNNCEKRTLIRALNQTNGNRTEAAQLLNIHRTSFYQKVKKHNIDLSDF